MEGEGPGLPALPRRLGEDLGRGRSLERPAAQTHHHRAWLRSPTKDRTGTPGEWRGEGAASQGDFVEPPVLG